MKRIERILQHRMMGLTQNSGARVIGFFALLFSLSIAVPLPFTNLIPAFAILLMSFGMLGKDGLIVLIGILAGITGFTITVLVLILGQKIVFGIIYKMKP